MPVIRWLLVLAGLASVPAYADECHDAARLQTALELLDPALDWFPCPVNDSNPGTAHAVPAPPRLPAASRDRQVQQPARSSGAASREGVQPD